jgi:hypothetical protein
MLIIKETIKAGAPWFATAGAAAVAFISLLLARLHGGG